MILKKLFATTLLLATILNVCAQTINCKKFKNGTFKMTYLGKNGIVKRKGNIQDEYYNGEKTPSLSFTVKWIDNCTYTLTPTEATRKLNPEIPKDGVMTVKITKTTTSSYSCSSAFNFNKTKVFNSELTLIK